MHLLASPMLFGLLLASVPIIIHLWNRRQFRLVEWAPMKYLKLTLKTNRRRMRIEQFILLAVRTLVIVLLFLALARPTLSRAGFGGWLASRARTSRVIVIDDSLSMGYLADRRTSFEIAREAADQIIRKIGSQDSVTVLLSSRPAQQIVRDASTQDPTKLLREISLASPADSSCDWAVVFKNVDDYFASAAYPQKELVLITDLRRAGWSAGVSTLTSQWAAQSVDLKVIDVGSRATQNVVLARFEQEESLALPGSPVKFRAAIRNDTASPIRAAQATLEIDGQSRPLVLPDLPPGQTTEVPVTLALAQTGPHVIRLSLPGDSLSADNTRWLTVTVRPEIRIAMIDGMIGSRPFESATDFLQVAFTAGTDAWHVTRRSDGEWQQAPSDPQLRAADVIVLANVANISSQQASALEKLVSAGTGLMIFGGEQLDPATYNQQLHRDSAGILPGVLSRAVEASANGLVIESFGDSPLAPLVKIAPEALSRVKPKRILNVAVDPSREQNVRVLARWNDSEAHPAVIEKRVGRGRVMLWTVSADRQWSDWPIDPTYVLAVRSAAMSIVRPEAAGNNVTAGQEIVYPLEEGQVARNALITAPDQSLQSLTPDNQVFRHASTARAGRYVLSWRDARDAEQTRPICASFDLSESSLDPISEPELTRLLSPMQPVYIHWVASGGGEALAEKGREIWRNVVLAVLMLAAVETALAVWVGRER